jgi:PAS domain S-box-containing protein
MPIDEQFRTVLQSLPVITFTATADGAIDWVSDRWYEATGIPHDAVLGDSWAAIVHPDDVEQVVWLWTHALDTGSPWEATPRIRHADGTYRWWFTRAERVEDVPGGPMWIGTTVELSAVPWKRIAALETSPEPDSEGERRRTS